MLFGFQDDGQLRAGNMASLQAGRQMGGKALRLIISRERVQKANGAYDFSIFDNIVNQARAQGIHPQIVLDNLEGFHKHGMGNPSKYEQFVKAAATHFKGRVGTYSLINEPDQKMAPQKYRELFVRGQRALSGVDRHASVLFGELSPIGGLDYAKKVIGKRGLTASGFAIHPYQVNDPLAPPDNSQNPWKWGIGRTRTMQHELAGMNLKTRAGKTPGLYFTEFGYNQSNPNAAGYWPRALQKARQAGVREMIAYTLTSGGPGQKWDTGLLNIDGTPRPAYSAIKASSRYTR